MDSFKLDTLDKKIIVALSDNGRRPYREISRELGVSESSIRQRINRMTECGFIRITVVGNLVELGFSGVAMVLLKVRADKVDEYANALAQYEKVRFVAVSMGIADIMFQSVNRDLLELHDFIRNELPKKFSEVTSIDILTQVRTVKSTSLDSWFELSSIRDS